jgi:hypothetical protein
MRLLQLYQAHKCVMMGSGAICKPHPTATACCATVNRCLVMQLQCALEIVGCHCGEDDMMWWQFGMATEAALRTFQVCGRHVTGPLHAGTYLGFPHV